VCDEQSGGVADLPVVLQPRTSSTAACIVVGTKRCQWQLRGRGEEPWLPRVPDRAAITVAGTNASYGGVSTGKVVRSTTRVVSAKSHDRITAPNLSAGQGI
jgi:hypothetical protein